MTSTLDRTTRRTHARNGRPTAARRTGYLVAIAINLAMLYVAHHLLEWGWPGFLMPDFEQVLPLITATSLAAVAVNVVYLAFDPPWLRSLGNLVTSALGIATAVRLLSVFPFDFSAYSRDWSWAARTLLVVAVVGGGIAVLAELVRLLTGRTARR